MVYLNPTSVATSREANRYRLEKMGMTGVKPFHALTYEMGMPGSRYRLPGYNFRRVLRNALRESQKTG
ncbi:MAG TPA: hypothetical protein VMW89_00345 [Desulfatiglandales bacterium]|nr:hypothetical protein [Desulfatiglandales bacterium]